jgi:phage terminase small subunit
MGKNKHKQDKEVKQVEAAKTGSAFFDRKLTPQQHAFVMAYCRPDISFNSTRAYMEAYNLDESQYSTAMVNGSKLLRNPKVETEIAKQLETRFMDNKELAIRTMNEWAKIAFLDLSEFLDVKGPVVYLKDISELPAKFRSAIKSIKNTTTGIEVQFHDKTKALEALSKCLGMFTENVRNVGEDYETIVEKIAKENKE